MAASRQWQRQPAALVGQVEVRQGEHVSLPELADSRDLVSPSLAINIPESELRIYHDTDIKALQQILDYGFQGSLHKDNITFSWWFLQLPDNEKNQLQRSVRGHGLPSPLISDDSRYGNYRVELSMTDALNSYKTSLGCSSVEFRVLGTYKYRYEVMYALVVHPSELAGCERDIQRLKDLPLIPTVSVQDLKLQIKRLQADLEFMATKGTNVSNIKYIQSKEILTKLSLPLYQYAELGNHTWHWNISSISVHNRMTGRCCRWDQVSFAFYLPKGWKFKIPAETIWDKLILVSSTRDTWLGRGKAQSKEEALKELIAYLHTKSHINGVPELINRFQTQAT